MKVLVFTAQGNFARFRLPYTTTSALTYSLIHPIAVKGLVGAIMGVDYSKLYEYTKDMKVGIQVLNPIRKDTQSFNLVPQTGSNGAANFQSKVEFLRDVKYRIFLSGDKDKLESIKEMLINRSFQFTPYLGASEHIAKIEYEELYNCQEGISNSLSDTVIPKEFLGDIDEESEIHLDRIPVQNSITREYIRYEKIAFSIKDKLPTKGITLYNVGGYNVYFL